MNECRKTVDVLIRAQRAFLIVMKGLAFLGNSFECLLEVS